METTSNNQLKRIDFEKGKFEANGKIYTIEGGLSISRYAELQILEKELGFGFTVKSIFDKLQTMWKNQNGLRFAENAVILNDLIRGIAKVQEREPVFLKICALFMNTEGEDTRTITKDMIDAKINDWKTEGLDMRDFFQAASSSVNGFLEIYRTVTRIISEQDGESQAENR